MPFGRAALCLLLCVPPLAVAREPVGGVISEDASSATSVEPVGDWLGTREILWREERIGLHLRTAYARPLRLPEPVALVEDPALSGCPVRLEGRIVTFEPSEHFAARPVDLVGLESGRRYRFRVRSSAEGKRIPIEIVVPGR